MGGSGHSTTTTDWPSWLQPYANQFAQQYMNLAMPGGQPAAYSPSLNQQVAPFNAAQNQGMGNIMSAAGGLQGLSGDATQQLDQTLQGKYLDPSTNPYLQQTYNQAARGVTDEYSMGTAPALAAEAQRAGAFGGGSGYDETAAAGRFGLGQNLAGLANQIYGGNYSQERQNQLGAQQMVGQTMQNAMMPGQAEMGVGTTQQQQSQLGLDTATQNATRQSQYPFTIMDQLGQALAGIRGPAGQSTTPIKTGALGGLK